jgi:1-acyl-sn-glycerol-3-phosphate acyltransferase
MQARAVQVLRIVRLALHLARGLFTAALLFPFDSLERRRVRIRRWSARLLAILRVHLRVHGSVQTDRPLMLVSNHVSWLDIFAIDAVMPVRFVAKSEVRAWPLLGWLSARSGTLFIDRTRRRDVTRINAEVGQALESGAVFAVFPEGTTSDGSTVLPFYGALLAPAIAVNAAVQPVAIRYTRYDGSLCIEAAFDGDKTFWDTVRAITSQRAIYVDLSFLDTVPHAARHRRHLAVELRRSIARTLERRAPHIRAARASDPGAAAR